MNIASLLRYMQLLSHIGHNILGGATFFQDHAFLSELYSAYEGHYDDIVERMIGLDEEIDLVTVQKYESCYKELLDFEEELCRMIEELAKGSSQGTIDLIGAIGSSSEVRQYKLKQRLK